MFDMVSNRLGRGCAFLCLLLSTNLQCTFSEKPNITVALMFRDLCHFLNYRHFKPPCDIAIASVNGDKGNYLMSLKSIWRHSGMPCGWSTMKAPGIAADLFYEDNVKAFFGSPDSDETEGIADLAAYWNIPILSGVSTYPTLDNKRRYSTLTRTSNKVSTLSACVIQLLKTFDWTAVAGIHTTIYYRQLFESLESAMIRQNVSVHTVYLTNENRYTVEGVRKAMANAVQRGRSKSSLV